MPKEITTDEVDMLVPGFKEALETPDEEVTGDSVEDSEDSASEEEDEGNPVEDGEDEDSEVVEKDPPSEEKETGQPDDKKVAAAISKANAKTQSELEAIAKLMQGKPELLEKLKNENEKLFNKLQKRLPDVFREPEEVQAEEKVGKLTKMLESVLRSEEDRELDLWRESNSLTKADFSSRQEELREYAITLVDEGLVPNWRRALDVAGQIVFPHLSGKPVNREKLSSMKGQGASTGKTTPKGSGYSAEEMRIMKDNSLTEEEYESFQKGSLLPPDIF
jgi:hypothetical protein